MDTNTEHRSRVKGWAGLIAGFAFLWFFAMYLGPAIYNHIPTYKKIVEVIEERDIDSGAYFYTEIKASYDGEAYLRQSFQTAAPDQYGFTWPFISGIVICIVILALGFKFMPDKQEPFNHR